MQEEEPATWVKTERWFGKLVCQRVYNFGLKADAVFDESSNLFKYSTARTENVGPFASKTARLMLIEDTLI